MSYAEEMQWADKGGNVIIAHSSADKATETIQPTLLHGFP